MRKLLLRGGMVQSIFVYIISDVPRLEYRSVSISILRSYIYRLWTTYILDQWKRHLTPKKFHFHWQMLHKESVQCELVNTPKYCAFMHGSTADLSLKNVGLKIFSLPEYQV